MARLLRRINWTWAVCTVTLRPPVAVIESPLPANIFRPPQTRANYFYYRTVIASSRGPWKEFTSLQNEYLVNFVLISCNISSLALISNNHHPRRWERRRQGKQWSKEDQFFRSDAGRNGAKRPLARDFRVRPILEGINYSSNEKDSRWKTRRGGDGNVRRLHFVCRLLQLQLN